MIGWSFNMDIRDEIIHGNAVCDMVSKIRRYWAEKYMVPDSNLLCVEKFKKAERWRNAHEDDIDEKDLFLEMMYVLEKDCSMASAFQNDLENYKKKDLRIVWVDRKPILLDFSSDSNSKVSPKEITQYNRSIKYIE